MVRDDKKSVHHLLQLHDAGFGKAHAPLALEVEWLGDHANGENAKLTRCLCNNGGRAGTGTAAHAGGDKHHMRAGQMFADRLNCLFRCGAPQFGLRAGAEALGHTSAHLDDALGLGLGERLCVGIGDDEIDSLKACRDHVIDSITAGAADPEHGNARLHLANIGDVAYVYFTIGHGLVLQALRSASTMVPVGVWSSSTIRRSARSRSKSAR